MLSVLWRYKHKKTTEVITFSWLSQAYAEVYAVNSQQASMRTSPTPKLPQHSSWIPPLLSMQERTDKRRKKAVEIFFHEILQP